MSQRVTDWSEEWEDAFVGGLEAAVCGFVFYDDLDRSWSWEGRDASGAVVVSAGGFKTQAQADVVMRSFLSD
jgi:hypothetical protein